jgi:hypothetical protein
MEINNAIDGACLKTFVGGELPIVPRIGEQIKLQTHMGLLTVTSVIHYPQMCEVEILVKEI